MSLFAYFVCLLIGYNSREQKYKHAGELVFVCLVVYYLLSLFYHYLLFGCNTREQKHKHAGELNVSAWEGNPLA